MSDATIECRTCGECFSWSTVEQSYYRDHGLSTPRHCPPCRARRRAARTSGSGTARSFAHRANSYRPPRPTRSPGPVHWRLVLRWVGPTLAATGLLAALVGWLLQREAAVAWLIAVNTVALALFAYDKAAAQAERHRVPEIALLSVTVLGGVVGGVLAMWSLRHKTSKDSFQIKFWLLASLPILLILAAVLIRS